MDASRCVCASRTLRFTANPHFSQPIPVFDIRFLTSCFFRFFSLFRPRNSIIIAFFHYFQRSLTFCTSCIEAKNYLLQLYFLDFLAMFGPLKDAKKARTLTFLVKPA